MAVNDSNITANASNRRLFFGTNVLVSIVLAAFVVVGINWLGHAWSVRRDLAGGFGSARISDRTKKVLGKLDKEVTISTVYASDEPDLDRAKYLPKLRDLTEEMDRFSGKVKVNHLYSGPDRAKLRDEVTGKFGSATEEYRNAVDAAKGLWSDLRSEADQTFAMMDQLMMPNRWLAGSTVLVGLRDEGRKKLEDIDNMERDVEDLTEARGVPRYEEANSKVKELNSQLKTYMEKVQTWAKDMDALARLLENPESEFAQQTRKAAQELTSLAGQLQATVGSVDDSEVPAEPKPVIQEFARTANKLASMVEIEKGRVDAYLAEHPELAKHPRWKIRQQQAIFVMTASLNDVLDDVKNNLSGMVGQIRQILQQEVPLDALQNVVRQLRTAASGVNEQLNANWAQKILPILDDGRNIDPATREFLAKGTSGDLFKEPLERIAELEKQIDELPEIELDDLGEKLQEENIVVIETEDDARVIPFDEVWVESDPTAGRRPSMGDEQAPKRRSFVGDAAISYAILSMQSETAFATVILVGFEPTPPAPPQQMQQQPPQPTPGPLPMSQFSELIKRLEGANFVVKQWNLAAEGEAGKQPEVEEGTEPIYIILPPANPPPQNPFQRQQMPQKEFTDADLQKVKDALADGGKAIFMATWLPPMQSFFQQESQKYYYSDYLKDEWGVDIKLEHRLIRAKEDRRDSGMWAIDPRQFNHLQLSTFSKDHPVGEPLWSRRMLLNSVCPVTAAEEVPSDVTVEPILEVPAELKGVWAANITELEQIINAIRGGDRGGLFQRMPEHEIAPPFSVMVAAENSKTNSKIIVFGSGFSAMDVHLQNRVPRLEGDEDSTRLVMDPPPTEVVELMKNSLYWLGGREDLIAAGPAEVPVVPVLSQGDTRAMWWVSMAWALCALVAGFVVTMVRSK